MLNIFNEVLKCISENIMNYKINLKILADKVTFIIGKEDITLKVRLSQTDFKNIPNSSKRDIIIN